MTESFYKSFLTTTISCSALSFFNSTFYTFFDVVDLESFRDPVGCAINRWQNIWIIFNICTFVQTYKQILLIKHHSSSVRFFRSPSPGEFHSITFFISYSDRPSYICNCLSSLLSNSLSLSDSSLHSFSLYNFVMFSAIFCI